jgi:3-oxoadipate enol-lactonase
LAKFSSEGASLYYSADGEGPAVILLHGLPLDHRMWFYQTFALSTRYRVIAPDIRGLSRSSGELDSCTFATFARDVCNLMDHEGVERATVVGLSFGGYIAQHVAVHHPDRVEGLVLTGTNPTTQYEVLQNKFEQNSLGYLSKNSKTHYRNHIASEFSPEFATSALCGAFMRSYEEIGDKARFEAVAKLFRIARTFDLKGRLPSLDVPSMVIAGEKDRAYQDCKTLAELIPRCEFVSIAGSGHSVPVESPAAFNEALLRLLKKATA